MTPREPRTAAGLNLLSWRGQHANWTEQGWVDAILAIEAEAYNDGVLDQKLSRGNMLDLDSPEAERRLAEALEQTTEALIVARRLPSTRKGSDFPGDPADMIYHGSVGHGAGMQCAVCDYEAAFDALIEANRALAAELRQEVERP